MNDNRKRRGRLLKQRDFDVLLIEPKDRLTRWGFHWFETLSPFRIEAVNMAAHDVHDLMEDRVAILTRFSARLYGPRRGRKRTEAAIKAWKGEG